MLVTQDPESEAIGIGNVDAVIRPSASIDQQESGGMGEEKWLAMEGLCQSHAAVELSMMGSGGSGGFRCGSGDYTSTPRMDKAGRGWLQRLGGSAVPTQLIGMSQISEGWAGLVWGHTQVNFRTNLQG